MKLKGNLVFLGMMGSGKSSIGYIISKKLDDYVVKHSEDEPALLKALTRETYQKILQPRMLSGHYQGRVLSTLSKLIKPKTILEFGVLSFILNLISGIPFNPNTKD